MARYAITGGTGFLGQALTRYLERSGHQVVIASPSRPAGSDREWLHYNLDDLSTIDNLVCADVSGIFHLAWSTIPSTAQRNPAADVRTNLVGTVALFQALSSAPPIPLLFVSSGGTVYGHPECLPIPEEHPLRPINAYGAGKVSAERFADLFRSTHNIDVRIARLSNPFGEGQNLSKLQGAASVFATKILAGETISIWGDGEVVRDYIHVDDAAGGIAAIMHHRGSGHADVPIYNVGSGEGLSLNSLIKIISDKAGRSTKVEYLPARTFDVSANVLDISKIVSEVGWRPRYSATEGLQRFVAALCAGPHPARKA
ncbi:NAD-dependent epimerase/dehydratase family protein [Bradyrhizobium sp. 33ap4]|uniref:NAD-dependent epimerase/dehydratase family protein n=1 Tax=Bradyrhizobium sp. 33ap4 TaxID=3061630 RepID=UPI00292FB499|nr:NAD-dependent epimerase/dehydratase family protein [Bradyrhizobium sp. 33ap4]